MTHDLAYERILRKRQRLNGALSKLRQGRQDLGAFTNQLDAARGAVRRLEERREQLGRELPALEQILQTEVPELRAMESSYQQSRAAERLRQADLARRRVPY